MILVLVVQRTSWRLIGVSSVYVFGNEYLEGDSLAREVASYLVGVDVVHCRSPDDLLDAPDDLTLLDVVKGVDAPLLIEDCSVLKTRGLVTMHDFDLAFFIALLGELGVKKNIRIIGVPPVGDARLFAKEVSRWL